MNLNLHIDAIDVLRYILIVGLLVVVHEWGHFIVSRLFGIRVDEFSIGFGPRAVRLGQLGDTEYNVRWIPMGGYVKIAGMEGDDEPLIDARNRAAKLIDPNKAKDTNATELPLLAENTPDRAEDEAQRKRDEIDGFYAKPLWQRWLVIFAGPCISFLLGLFIFCVIGVTTGVENVTTTVKAVNPGSVASSIGLKAGDKIVSIDGKPIKDGEAMIDKIHASAGIKLHLTVAQPDGATVVLVGTPKLGDAGDGTKVGLFGFLPQTSHSRVSLADGLRWGWHVTTEVVQGIANLFIHFHLQQIRQNAGGPIFIGQMIHETAKEAGPPGLWALAAQLTISLAIFNLLPIPILDGGHLVMIFVEGLRRGRRLTMQQQQNYMLAGLAIIGTLFVLILANDILRTIHNKIPHLQ